MSKQRELSEYIGMLCGIIHDCTYLSEALNDCWCEDHRLELSEKQRSAADKADHTLREMSAELQSLLSDLRGGQ